jgi:ATP-dependent helicase/nuclease subunit B
VEKNIFEFDPPRIDAGEDIRIVSAPNARTEVRFVARQILELIREGNCRYRDIAVIASDIESYQHYIGAYFDYFDIPFFIDKRKPLNHHPAVQLVCSALEVVTGGFSHGDVFAYLKTDLAAVGRRDVDMLENYCLAFGISDRDWQSDRQWQFAGKENSVFDEKQINHIRNKISAPLLDLRQRLYTADDDPKELRPGQFTQAVFAFLDDLDVKKTIGRWMSEAEVKKDSAAADEHQQFYNKFVDIFDELVAVFEGRTMTAEDYLAILNSAFSQLTLAFIPPTLDQVLVGSIERSRHPALKAVFLIGATQRKFPVPISSDSILTDDDRLAAESADFPLAPASSQSLTERQYLAYIAFTRPSEFLCITYPAADEKGAAVPRSQFIDDLQSLFNNLNEEPITGEFIDIETITDESELVDLLCTGLGRDVPAPEAADEDPLNKLLGEMSLDQDLSESAAKVRAALEYDNSARLHTDAVEKYFDGRIRSSATRLSTFAACPYRHFARYMLQLEKRREFKFEPLDLGRFYHRILDALTRRLNSEDKDFATVDDDELLSLLREEIEKLIKEDSFISNFVNRRGYNEFIIKSAAEVLEDCVLAIAQMVRAGSFRPKLSEVPFGRVKDTRQTLGECEFKLHDGRVLSLDGKIDRLDVADIDGQQTAIVFDYKRRDTSFSWAKFYHGLDMQLPVYMLAVRKTASVQPANVAGAFFMPIEVSPEKTTLDKLSQRTESFDYKAKGIFDGRFARHLDADASKDSRYYNFYVTKDDRPYGSYGNRGALKPGDFDKMLLFAEEQIVSLAIEISSGKIDITPYRLNNNSPCSYCEYKSVCRFDWQINNYNPLSSLGKKEVLERLEVNDG